MKTENFSIRMSLVMKQKLEFMAKREHRTLSNYIEMILLNHIGIVILKEEKNSKEKPI